MAWCRGEGLGRFRVEGWEGMIATAMDILLLPAWAMLHISQQQQRRAKYMVASESTGPPCRLNGLHKRPNDHSLSICRSTDLYIYMCVCVWLTYVHLYGKQIYACLKEIYIVVKVCICTPHDKNNIYTHKCSKGSLYTLTRLTSLTRLQRPLLVLAYVHACMRACMHACMHAYLYIYTYT